MNALDLGGAVPTVGGATILLVIIGILTRLWIGAENRSAAELRRYATAHEAELGRIATAHEAELKRINRAHDEEIAELKQDIVELRGRVDELTAQLDQERRARWKAEDVAAKARRQSGDT